METQHTQKNPVTDFQEYLKRVYQTDKLPQDRRSLVTLNEQLISIIQNAFNTLVQINTRKDVLENLDSIEPNVIHSIQLLVGDLSISKTIQTEFPFVLFHNFEDNSVKTNLIESKVIDHKEFEKWQK